MVTDGDLAALNERFGRSGRGAVAQVEPGVFRVTLPKSASVPKPDELISCHDRCVDAAWDALHPSGVSRLVRPPGSRARRREQTARLRPDAALSWRQFDVATSTAA
jgi:hypothetical protein